MVRVVILFLFYLGLFFGRLEALQLATLWEEAHVGDFVVLSHDRIDELWHVIDRDGLMVTVEEISLPHRTHLQNWQEWLLQGAPGNLSWAIYEIDLRGFVRECYSVTRQQWLETNAEESFLATLLKIDFKLVSEGERKRLGSENDFQTPLWQPRLYINGHCKKGVYFHAWKASWPQDGSELAGKTIEIYLLAQGSEEAPNYFPYWVEMRNGFGNLPFHVVDSGTNLKPFYAEIPRPRLRVEGHPQWHGSVLEIKVFARDYVDDLVCFAEDPQHGAIIELPSHCSKIGPNLQLVKIARDDLEDLLTAGHSYYFSFSSPHYHLHMAFSQPWLYNE